MISIADNVKFPGKKFNPKTRNQNFRYRTLQEHQKTLTWSKISDTERWVSIMVTHEKKVFGMMVQNWRHCNKMILQKYCSFWIDPTYILVFTVYLGMAEIFTDSFKDSNKTAQKAKNTWLFVHTLLTNLQVSQTFLDLYTAKTEVIDHHCELQSVSFDVLVFVRFFWCSCGV